MKTKLTFNKPKFFPTALLSLVMLGFLQIASLSASGGRAFLDSDSFDPTNNTNRYLYAEKQAVKLEHVNPNWLAVYQTPDITYALVHDEIPLVDEATDNIHARLWDPAKADEKRPDGVILFEWTPDRTWKDDGKLHQWEWITSKRRPVITALKALPDSLLHASNLKWVLFFHNKKHDVDFPKAKSSFDFLEENRKESLVRLQKHLAAAASAIDLETLRDLLYKDGPWMPRIPLDCSFGPEGLGVSGFNDRIKKIVKILQDGRAAIDKRQIELASLLPVEEADKAKYWGVDEDGKARYGKVPRPGGDGWHEPSRAYLRIKLGGSEIMDHDNTVGLEGVGVNYYGRDKLTELTKHIVFLIKSRQAHSKSFEFVPTAILISLDELDVCYPLLVAAQGKYQAALDVVQKSNPFFSESFSEADYRMLELAESNLGSVLPDSGGGHLARYLRDTRENLRLLLNISKPVDLQERRAEFFLQRQELKAAKDEIKRLLVRLKHIRLLPAVEHPVVKFMSGYNIFFAWPVVYVGRNEHGLKSGGNEYNVRKEGNQLVMRFVDWMSTNFDHKIDFDTSAIVSARETMLAALAEFEKE